MANTRKRIFRVVADSNGTGNGPDQVCSKHISKELAYREMAKFEEYAAKGQCGLTPAALFNVQRWDGKTWTNLDL